MSVIEVWATFDLDGRRASLDAQGLQIAEQQSACLASRKRLAGETKGFRKTTDASEQRRLVGPLLSAYQKEIDKLTKRSRSAEFFFLDLYKQLYELPDPVPLLRQSSTGGSGETSKRECRSLRSEVAELEKELSGLTNQDITIRELEEQLAESAAQVEQRVAEAVARREAELLERAGQTTAAVARQEAELEEQLEAADRAAAEHQKAHDDAESELFELRALLEEKEAAHQEEVGMFADDAARSSLQVATLQHEAQRLRGQLADERASSTFAAGDAEQQQQQQQQQQPSKLADDRRRDEYESEISRLTEASSVLRFEMAKLRTQSQALREEQCEERTACDRRLGQLESQLRDAAAELELRPKLAAHEQVNMIHAVKFNSGDAVALAAAFDSVAASATAAPEHFDSSSSSSTEHLHMAKVRKLESEASTLRVRLGVSEAALAVARRATLVAEERLGDERSLVGQLEAEALVFQLGSGSQPATRSATVPGSGANSIEEGSDSRVRASLSPQAAQLMQQATLDAGNASMATIFAMENCDEQAPDSSMLLIMREQRDRFRARMLVLEAERGELMAKVVKHRGASEQVRADNVQLFERIKYLQSFRSGKPTGSRIEHLNPNQMSEIEMGGAKGSEARYASLYEQRSNPFSNFKALHRRRQYKRLSVMDRVTLDCTHFFLLNKYTRGFLFCYALFVHALVFGISWVYTHRQFKQCA